MIYHKDSEVESALIRLMDTLCTWERNTGRESTLILIQEGSYDNLLWANSGKPVSHSPFLLNIQLDRIKTDVLGISTRSETSTQESS